MNAIATRLDRLYAYAPSEQDVLPNMVIARSDDAAARAIRAGAHRIAYVPDRSELPRVAEIVNAHVDLILQTGAAWGFEFHELGDIADERRTPPAVHELYRAGAKLGHVTLAAFQRTVTLPRIAISQSNRVFLFATYDQDERDRAAAYMGDAVRAPLPLPFDYSFWYRGPDGSLIRCAALK